MYLIDRRQEKAKHDQTDSAAPTRHPTEEMEVDGVSTVAGQQPDAESKDGGGKESKEGQRPQKRYRLTEPMKNIVWQLVLLSNECCRLENEKKCVSVTTMLVIDDVLFVFKWSRRLCYSGQRTRVEKELVSEDCPSISRWLDEFGAYFTRR